MHLLYNIGIKLFGLFVWVFSLFNEKARLFIKGRANVFDNMLETLAERKHIWFHFASLGEFEQGRPVLEKIKERYPQKRIVITFFSPSGYEIRKDYPLAEGVFYLPLDTAENAEKLINIVDPELVIFTKYEYWYHYFKALSDRQIPLIVISAIFRPKQIFFKPYGSLHREMLRFVDAFYVQNDESRLLLESIGIESAEVSGDTRFDRVAANAFSPKTLDKISEFCNNKSVLIAGSTWPEDENLLATLLPANPDWKFIIAPHEINKKHIEQIRALIPTAARYSSMIDGESTAQVLIIDNIGLLSSIYQYGRIAYIGGGFGAGIHNTLEAAAFGLPVIFGPRYDKFQEAKDLIALQAAVSITNQQELETAFRQFSTNNAAGSIAKGYVLAKSGSTDQIMDGIDQYLSP
jgi:3-deoxy-D-manno-octulosonic-acid transferase